MDRHSRRHSYKRHHAHGHSFAVPDAVLGILKSMLDDLCHSAARKQHPMVRTMSVLAAARAKLPDQQHARAERTGSYLPQHPRSDSLNITFLFMSWNSASHSAATTTCCSSAGRPPARPKGPNLSDEMVSDRFVHLTDSLRTPAPESAPSSAPYVLLATPEALRWVNDTDWIGPFGPAGGSGLLSLTSTITQVPSARVLEPWCGKARPVLARGNYPWRWLHLTCGVSATRRQASRQPPTVRPREPGRP